MSDEPDREDPREDPRSLGEAEDGHPERQVLLYLYSLQRIVYNIIWQDYIRYPQNSAAAPYVTFLEKLRFQTVPSSLYFLLRLTRLPGAEEGSYSERSPDQP